MTDREVDHLEMIGGPYCGQRATIPASGNDLLLSREAFGEQPRSDPRRVLYRREGNKLVYYKVIAIGNTRQAGGRNES